MRILLFAYYFPPDGGGGTQRPASFASHFARLGASCTVVTRSPPTNRGFFEPEDSTLMERVAGCARIVRTASNGDARNPDAWMTAAEQLGEREIQRERPDVILLTMSPFSLWRVGKALGDRHRIPVVFDLRDPWALDGVRTRRTWLHWRFELQEMKAMLRRADGVVANTPECKRLFAEIAPTLPPDRIGVVTNGWEREDFAPPSPRFTMPGHGSLMRLVYVGTFLTRYIYRNHSLRDRIANLVRFCPETLLPSGRTPKHLLEAIRDLRQRGSPAGHETRFVVVGQGDPWTERCIAESGVADAVELKGYVSHAECVDLSRSADALFLTLHGLAPGHRSRIVPGKTYEYLATGRPILGALPEGDAREFLQRSGRAFLADPCDSRALATAIEQLHAAWRRGEFIESQCKREVEQFERGALAAQLLGFLKTIVARAEQAAR